LNARYEVTGRPPTQSTLKSVNWLADAIKSTFPIVDSDDPPVTVLDGVNSNELAITSPADGDNTIIS
jgi:hypothetical protein